jgi:AcrR family transcriptional regulator
VAEKKAAATAGESRISGSAAPPLDLRSRKQRRAREEAARVASRLFRERGYDATSLEEIADQAEMSVSSLLRYFGSKERLALARHVDHLEAFRSHLAAEGKPTIERWRSFIVDQTSSLQSFDTYHQERQLIVSVPALLRLLSRIQLDQQDELAAAFAAEAGLDPEEDLYGRLLAALLVAGNEAVYIQWLRSKGRGDLAQMSLAVVDFAATRLGSRDEAAIDFGSMARAVGDDA